jgi:hypothetical protein
MVQNRMSCVVAYGKVVMNVFVLFVGHDKLNACLLVT